MDIVVLGYARTPFGRLAGGRTDLPGHVLAARTVDALLSRAGVEPDAVEALYAGTSASGARDVVLASQLPATTPAMTVDRAGCSGMTAIGLGWTELLAGRSDLVICGGFEGLSRAALPARTAAARRSSEALPAQGVTPEMEQAWVAQSRQRFFAAEAEGVFEAECFTVEGRTSDDVPRRGARGAAPGSLPANEDGSAIAAGNTAEPADGAAFLLLASAERAGKLAVKPLARLVDYAPLAGEPAADAWLPALAIRSVMKRQGRAMYEIDLVEINEDCAATPLLSLLWLGSRDPQKAAELRDRTNIHGGAMALGHPLGASGARITMTLINALARRGGGRGVAAISDGLGQGDAVMVEV